MVEKQYNSCKHCCCCGHGSKRDCKSFENGREMSKKQFIFTKDTVSPNLKTPIVFNNETMSIGEVLDKLNELSDENEQLRKENDMLSCELSVSVNKEISRNCRITELEEENKQLKQFKEDVFNKIDMHLRMLPTVRDNEFNEEYGNPSLYTGAIYILETLKKELKE